jgi:sensor domain CHASE-containing protein
LGADVKHLREYLLILAYVILVGVVVVESFFIADQFDNSHKDQCAIAQAQAQLAVVNLALVTEPATKAKTIKVINGAIRTLNDTCETDVPEIPE